MNKLFAVLLAVTLGVLGGCAAGGTGNADRDNTTDAAGSSGITVFGTVDAAVSHTKTR